jgi:hypothetical protein
MPWKKMLAWAAGQIEPILLQKLEFVLEENRVYRTLLDRHAPHRRLTNPERIALAQKGQAAQAPTAITQSQCLRRTLGASGKGLVPQPIDSIR